jgi:hypothetical protein
LPASVPKMLQHRQAAAGSGTVPLSAAGGYPAAEPAWCAVPGSHGSASGDLSEIRTLAVTGIDLPRNLFPRGAAYTMLRF